MELSSYSTRESRENLNSKFFENLKILTVIFSNFQNLTVKNWNSYFWDYIHSWRSRSIEDNLRIENLVVWRSNSICTMRKVYVKSNKLSKKHQKTSKNVKNTFKTKILSATFFDSIEQLFFWFSNGHIFKFKFQISTVKIF